MIQQRIINIQPQDHYPKTFAYISGDLETRQQQLTKIERYCLENDLILDDCFSGNLFSSSFLDVDCGTIVLTDLRLLSNSVEKLSQILFDCLMRKISIIPIAQNDLISLFDFEWLEENGYLDTEDRIRRDVQNIAEQVLLGGSY